MESTLFNLISVWRFLSRKRRIQFALLLFVMFASAFSELFSLSMVLPFLSVLSNPNALWNQSNIRDIARYVGISEPNQLLLPCTVLFAFSAILAASIRLLNLRLNGKLAAAAGSDLSCEAYKRTLYQPYSVQLMQNTSSIINTTTTQISVTVTALNATLQLISSTVIAIGLLLGILFIDFKVALLASLVFGSAYGFLASTVRRELRINGEKTVALANRQIQALQEGLGAIRDVLIDNTQSTYLDIYKVSDRPQRHLQAKNIFLSAFPRYALEALGMILIAALGYALVLEQGSSNNIIPLLGALALGAQRLLPALQQIYSAWASLKGYNASIAAVVRMLRQEMPMILNNIEPLKFSRSIRFKNVCFNYTSANKQILTNLNFEILLGERIGIIGSTGSGKSTTVDLLMGLLKPTAGEVLVDDVDINDPSNPRILPSWRATISHVPQNIYLADTSNAENIALGVKKESIDMDRVKR